MNEESTVRGPNEGQKQSVLEGGSGSLDKNASEGNFCSNKSPLSMISSPSTIASL